MKKTWRSAMWVGLAALSAGCGSIPDIKPLVELEEAEWRAIKPAVRAQNELDRFVLEAGSNRLADQGNARLAGTAEAAPQKMEIVLRNGEVLIAEKR